MLNTQYNEYTENYMKVHFSFPIPCRDIDVDVKFFAKYRLIRYFLSKCYLPQMKVPNDAFMCVGNFLGSYHHDMCSLPRYDHREQQSTAVDDDKSIPCYYLEHLITDPNY